MVGRVKLLHIILAAAVCAPCLSAPAAAKGSAGSHGWENVSDGYKVTWTSADLRAVPVSAPDKQVFSGKRMAHEQFAKDQDSDSHCTETRTFRLLSLIGDILSYEDDEEGFCEGAAHPYGEARFAALNLRKGGVPAKLTDFFFPEDIYNALMADKVVQRALQECGKQPANLDQLLSAFGEGGIEFAEEPAHGPTPLCFTISNDVLTRFAFHHVDRDKVAVRLGLSGTNLCRSNLTELGILLPVPQILQEELEAAEKGQNGLLMRDAERLSKNIHTTINLDSNRKHSKTSAHKTQE